MDRYGCLLCLHGFIWLFDGLCVFILLFMFDGFVCAFLWIFVMFDRLCGLI